MECDFFCVAAHDLLDAQRKRAPLLDADQGQRKKRQPWHRLAVQTGKEPIQAMGDLAGFGDDDFVAHEQVGLLGPIHMVPKEHPKQRGPRHHRREKALHRPIATPLASPAEQASPRHSSRHDHHRHSNAAEMASGRRGHRGLKAWEQCYNIDHRWAPLLWFVRCRFAQRNSTRQRTTSPHF